MKYVDNISELANLLPDYIGFIFYHKSPRYIENLEPEYLSGIPASIQKVGVFVNENIYTVLEIAFRYQLSLVQLHGDESPEYCAEIKRAGFPIIKTFSVKSKKDFNNCLSYEEICDFYLFDTKNELRGGSGEKFNWELLKHYNGKTPFFLSGGIEAEDKEILRQFRHLYFYGIDLNSRFEIEPGIKNIQKLKQLIE